MRRGYTLLSGGIVVDGSSGPGIAADVLISDGQIEAIDTHERLARVAREHAAVEIIHCEGCIVAPGFIDGHSHSDLQVLEGRLEKVNQGVTTEVVGNCGFSPYPLPTHPNLLRNFANGILCGHGEWGWHSSADYLQDAHRSQVTTVVSLVGHGSLRIRVAGNACRELQRSELEEMSWLLDEQLSGGACGLSSGLMYAPGSAASQQELVSLCEVVARRDGVYTTHIRSYSSGLVEAVEEQVRIAELAGCRLLISHLQAVGAENWHLQQRAIDAIESAALRGVDVSFDAYPWTAGATVLTQLLPQEYLDGGLDEFLKRIRNLNTCNRLLAALELEHGRRWNDLYISSASVNTRELVGRSIAEIAAERQVPASQTVIDLLAEQGGETGILEYNQSMDNLRALLTHPLATVVSDGFYTRGRPHPRLYGTFPALLGEMVRDRKWLSIEEAVHKISGLPAARFRLRERGLLRPGKIADITVFDPSSVCSGATYEQPTGAPIGIVQVIRNGELIVDKPFN